MIKATPHAFPVLGYDEARGRSATLHITSEGLHALLSDDGVDSTLGMHTLIHTSIMIHPHGLMLCSFILRLVLLVR